jgi:hypothetical protein
MTGETVADLVLETFTSPDGKERVLIVQRLGGGAMARGHEDSSERMVGNPLEITPASTTPHRPQCGKLCAELSGYRRT